MATGSICECDLPWVWIVLLELNLMRGNRLPVSIEDQESGTSGALVDRSNEDVLGRMSRNHDWRVSHSRGLALDGSLRIKEEERKRVMIGTA